MEKQKITLAIATTSKDKIDGIRKAFRQYLPEEEFEIKIYSSKTESDVPNQPFGNDTYQGAYNRINNMKEKFKEILKEQGIDVDYYVSCEAGIDDTNKAVVNGKITTIYASEQVVCIYNPKQDSYSFGKSSSWTIPEEDIEEIKNKDLDQYLKKRGCTGLQEVGNGKYGTRSDAVMEGTKSAIASGLFIERCYKAKQNHENDINERQNR